MSIMMMKINGVNYSTQNITKISSSYRRVSAGSFEKFSDPGGFYIATNFYGARKKEDLISLSAWHLIESRALIRKCCPAGKHG